MNCGRSDNIHTNAWEIISLLLLAVLILLPLVHNLCQADQLSAKASASSVDLSPVSYDFHDINPLDSGALQHAFTLTNSGATPITIVQLQPSCHCTTASITPTGSPTSISGDSLSMQNPVTIQPGKSVTLNVTIKVAGETPGDFTKYVTIVTDPAQPVPSAVSVHFRLAPVAQIKPEVVSFGEVHFGDTKTLPVTLLVDKRLLSADPRPTLVSDSPFVTSTAIDWNHSSALDSSSNVAVPCTVTLSKSAPICNLNSTLTLTTPKSNLRSDLAEYWQNVRAVVIGRVTGDVQAIPASVSFGQVVTGKSATCSFNIIGPMAALKSVNCAPDSAWVDASVGDIQPCSLNGTPSYQRLVTATLVPTTVTGGKLARLNLAYSDGEVQTVPLTVYLHNDGSL